MLSGDPSHGQLGPYHHGMTPHHQMLPQMHYLPEQMPTTSHPSWHQQQPLPVQYPAQPGPQTVHYPVPGQQQPPPPPHPPMQQQQQMQPQPRPNYSTPSPSGGPPSAPSINQKARTEQWIQNQAWSYGHSPAGTIVPSVMSHYPADDRMSMLSVNTTMTNQYPEASSRCYSSNGSMCENVNPVHANVTQNAMEALRCWGTTQDPVQKCRIARAVRIWVQQEKFANVETAQLQECFKQLLDVVHDGLRFAVMTPPQPFTSQFLRYLMEIMDHLRNHPNSGPFVSIMVQKFIPEPTPNGPTFRELICNLLHLQQQQDSSMLICAHHVFNLLKFLIEKTSGNEKMRAEFAQSLKFPQLFDVLLTYFSPSVQLRFAHSPIRILRFVTSKDKPLKDFCVWKQQQTRNELPRDSFVVGLNLVLTRVVQELPPRPIQELQNDPETGQLVYLALKALDLLRDLLHDKLAIEAYVKFTGLQTICSLLHNLPHMSVIRSCFELLLQISDAEAFREVNLTEALPFILQVMRRSSTESVLSCGTGFLSNVVASKQHVKDLAIGHGAIQMMHGIVAHVARPIEVDDVLRRKQTCDTICNSLRTVNNFLIMWTPKKDGETKEAGDMERQQICKFVESDFLSKLMLCLTEERKDTPAVLQTPLLELRSTILRFVTLLLRTPFVPKEALLACIVDPAVAVIGLAGQEKPRTELAQRTKQQLTERAINLLVVLIEKCSSEDLVVSRWSYSMCPLSLLAVNETNSKAFLYNVLFLADKILEKCPDRAEIWTIDRPRLEQLSNHQDADIARTAASLLNRCPLNDMLAGLMQFGSS